MGIFDLFSKRQADAASAGAADVYQYDTVSPAMRVQVAQIAVEGIGKLGQSGSVVSGSIDNGWWAELERLYCREKGVHRLGTEELAGQRILGFMAKCSTEDWLDLLEVICLGITIAGGEDNHRHRHDWQVSVTVENAIDEINYRLRQASLGYQIEGIRLIRMDSQFLHTEVVRPALALIAGKRFAGPQQEFMEAHAHYRRGEHRQAVAMAANALESTLKAVFDQKSWPYNKGARISDLVKVAKAHGLWPTYMDGSFDQLLATLQSGLPKIRDNDAAHGQGSEVREVPGYVAAYALHLCASKIVFITEAARASR